MSKDQVSKKIKYRTKQQWREIVADFEQSNLSQSGYCRRHNIPTSTFSKWRTQFGSSIATQNQPDSKTKFSTIIPAQANTLQSAVTIKAHLSPSLTLEWSEQTSPTYIAQLLKVLSHAI